MCCGEDMLIAVAVKTDPRTGQTVDPALSVRPVRAYPVCMSGKEMQVWRRARNYTLQALSEQLGVTPQTVLRYESLDVVPRHIELALKGLDVLAETGKAGGHYTLERTE